MEILFTFRIKDYQEEALKSEFPELTFLFDKKVADTELETAEIIVTYGNDIDDTVIERAQCLKWIMVASAGLEKMPLNHIESRKITVTNARGIHKTPMAESVLAHILALQRGIIPMHELQKRNEWNRKLKLVELKGSTAIILGPGAIGSEIGRLLQAFGVRTIGCNRSGNPGESMDETIIFDDLSSKLSEADFLISVLPSTTETKNLLTAEHFNAMKDSVVFMNFGRGDLVDEALLIQVLKDKVIGHAVLDVFQVEPLPVNSELWTLPNCTVSPHSSSFSSKYIERSLEIFHINLYKWLIGDEDMVNSINAGEGY